MKKLVKYENIEYFMPFLFCNDLFIPVLQKLLENEKNPVKYVYGSPYCKWGVGPRSTILRLQNLNIIDMYFSRLKNIYKVIPALTFTYLEIKDRLNDEYSNNLLDIAYKNDCCIIVSTKELYKHIKTRYPDAKMHCSILAPMTKAVEDKNFDETRFYNEMLDKYEVVVVRPEYVIENIHKLDKLIWDISRIEVLINQYCHFNCPYHRIHYNFFAEIDECNGDIEKIKKVKYYSEEGYGNEHFSLCPKFTEDYRSVHMTEDQVDQVINMGVKKIKIQGRSLLFDALYYELYSNFFNNNEYSEEEIKNKIDNICADMIKQSRKMSLIMNL